VNRRHARRRGLVFHRLLQHAVRAAPVAYKDLVKVGAAKPVRPLPPGVRRERIVREWFEVDGRWVRLGFPAALVDAVGLQPTVVDEPATDHETLVAAMNGLLSRWVVAAGSKVTAGMSLGAMEAMKMETPIIADRPGTFTPLVAEGAAVKEGQPIATIK